MQLIRVSQIIRATFAAVLLTIVFGNAASAADRERAYGFNGANGAGGAGLRLDPAGNLWGTSYSGGAYGYGDVFELTRNAQGLLSETVLYSFTNGSDGGNPADDEGPTPDMKGNLYGTTTGGGALGGGTVFELTPSPSGWQESVLYSFTCGNDGCPPEGGVVFDAAGNLYGTTSGGGPGGSGYGTVFELSPESNGNWTETTLHVFTGGSDGAGSYTGLIFDRSGNLYGTTSAGGSGFCDIAGFFGCGVVFELTHTPTGWNQQVLYSFTGGTDGTFPIGRLAFDRSGNLYGTAAEGGDPSCGCGTVFRLAPTATPGGPWSQSVLYTFTGGSDGAFPAANVIFDAAGNLYSTATDGGKGSCGRSGCGTVFELAPGSGGAWNFSLLYSFLGKSDGGSPRVIGGAAHKLYGATDVGGYFGGSCAIGGCGTVFEITDVSGKN